MSKVHRSIGRVYITNVLLVFFLFLFAIEAKAQVPVSVGPEPKTQFLDNAGAPLAGGIVCTYQAGTSTPFATYTDATGSVQNSNPVVLDSAGRANIWWQAAAYKVVLAGGGTCASPSNLMWTVDGFSVGVFLAGNNTWSGTNTFNGNVTVNGTFSATAGGELDGSFSGNPNFTGSVTYSGSLSISQLTLTQATGMPPLVVTSTTVIPNINVEILNGVSFPASPALHSVPVITSTNTAAWHAIPDCPSGILQFSQSSNAFSCGSAFVQTLPTLTVKSGTNGGDYSTSSASLANVDGTNLSYTVSIPVGWKLLITAVGTEGFTGSNASDMLLALADGGSAVAQMTQEFSSGGSPAAQPFALTWLIAGDGMSHTVTLQWSSPGSHAAVMRNASGNVPVMTFVLTPSN